MAGVYDGETYTFCETVADLVDTLLHRDSRGTTFYAHNGGRFDFLLLLPELRRRGLRVDFIAQGSSVIQVKIHLGKNRVKLCDSMALFSPSRFSLDQLTQVFQVTRKMTGAIDFEKERVDKNNPTHREYLRVDCVALQEVIEKFKTMPYVEETGIKVTGASQALAAWRTTLPYEIRMTPQKVQDFVRRAYAGGRVEVFRQVIGENHACFDINSLFPTQMRTRPLPLEVIGPSKNHAEFGFHDVTVEIPKGKYLPPLWVKCPKLVFPTGIFRGTYFSEEIKAAESYGAKVLRHHKGYAFTQSRELFRDFVDTCYQLRLENPDSPVSLVAKNLMNGCYGKTGEREERESMMQVDPEDPATWPEPPFDYWRDERTFEKYGLIVKHSKGRRPHMLVHIAAAITAWARVTMLERYAEVEDSIAYTDTDSIYCRDVLENSRDLGRLKREYGVRFGYFLGAKAYYLELDDGRVVKKIKGFRKKDLEKITRKDFESGNISVEGTRLLTFREALIRKNEYLSLATVKKSLRAGYDKRCLLPGGDTRPWHYENGDLK